MIRNPFKRKQFQFVLYIAFFFFKFTICFSYIISLNLFRDEFYVCIAMLNFYFTKCRTSAIKLGKDIYLSKRLKIVS